jgi:hypothetical protein
MQVKTKFFNKIIFILIIIFLINSINNSHSNTSLENQESKSFIKKISSFYEVDFNKFSNTNDIVIFDIDHTILNPNENYLKCFLSNETLCTKKFLQMQNLYGDKIDINILLGFLLKDSEFSLTESNIVDKINILKNNNVNFISITSVPSGFNYGLKDSFQNWRFQSLKKFGIEFSFSDLVFLINLQSYGRPIFYKGILLTDYRIKKSYGLKEFLKIVQYIKNYLEDSENNDNKKFLKFFLNDTEKNITKYKDILSFNPKRVIVFDDYEENLIDIMNFCEKEGLEFHGYLYKNYDISPLNNEDEKRLAAKINDFMKIYNK